MKTHDAGGPGLALDIARQVGNGGRAAAAIGAAPILAGDLHHFRGYDICQLLTMTGATGVLRLRSMGVKGEIFVEEGRVVGAWARPNPRRLGHLLLGDSAVGEDDLQAALRTQTEGYRAKLGEILLARGAIHASALDQALVRQSETALTALLILPAGRFTFEPGPVPASCHRITVDPQGLVLEALARIDELRGGLREAADA